MTDEQIMDISFDDMVQICILRYEDMKEANRVAAFERKRVYMRGYKKERRDSDPEFRKKLNEINSIYRKKRREQSRQHEEKAEPPSDREKAKHKKGYDKAYYERHKKRIRAYQKKYRERKRALSEWTAQSASEKRKYASEKRKYAIRKAVTVMDAAVTAGLSDAEKMAIWDGRIATLRQRYDSREIELEEYIRERNNALSMRDYYEELSKKKRRIN